MLMIKRFGYFVFALLLFLFIFTMPSLMRADDENELRRNVFKFVMDGADGLYITAGYGQANYVDMFLAQTNTISNDLDDLLYRNANNVQFIHLGLELGKSFVDLRVAPYISPATNILFIEAESGAWIIGPKKRKKKSVALDIGVVFFGSVITFQTPLISKTEVTNFLPSEVSKFNSGIGLVNVGIGVPIIIAFNFGKIVHINFGVYGRMGVALPYTDVFHSLTLSYGIIGPNVEIMIIPKKLGLYFHLKPYKSCYDMTYWEAGLRIGFN